MNKWIPVSERLPESDTEIIFTIRNGCRDYEDDENAEWEYNDITVTGTMSRYEHHGYKEYWEYTDEFGDCVAAFYNGERERWWNERDTQCECYHKVLAWMPLPEPYKESEE